MTALTRALGVRGERLAEQHLIDKGVQLLTRNYRIPMGEIDLVMEDEGELVAVEVKTRCTDDIDQPEEAVNRRKLYRIVQALTAYAADKDYLEKPWRIDVVVIQVGPDGGVVRLEHLRSVYPT
jgi:putative endonuclease